MAQALDVAYEQRGRPQGLLFHSDQGCQYASRKFRQRLWRYRKGLLLRQGTIVDATIIDAASSTKNRIG